MKKKVKSVNVNKEVLITMLLTSSVLLGGGNAFAAEEEVAPPTFTLEQMIVSVTRTMKDVKEVPASVDVITAEEIAAKNVTSVREALQMKTGVYMNPKALGDISIRGFGSTDILVLLDGQPMNSGWNGTMNWEMIPVERIARIEIVRGAASSLYGGRAVGAVVNITTKDNEKNTSVDTVVSYDSNNTWKKSLYFDQKLNDKLSIGAGYEKSSSDGYRGFYRAIAPKKSGTATVDATLPKLSDGSYVVGGRGEKDWDNENNSFTFKYKFDEHKSLKYNYMKSKNEYSYQNPFSYVIDANGNQIFKGVVKTQDGLYVTLTPANFLGYVGKRETDLQTINYQDAANKIQLNLGLSDTTKDGYSSPNAPTTIDWQGKGTNSFYPSKTYNVDFQKTWENVGKHNIVAGFNGKEESFAQTKYNMSNWTDHGTNLDVVEQHGGKGKNVALFVQDEYKMSDPVTLYAGLRYDYYKKYDGYSHFYTNGVFNPTASKEHASGSYQEVSPKLAVEYRADAATRYYASYGHSFNSPILYQVYRTGIYSIYDNTPTYLPNPDLAPEISDTFEIGMKKALTKKTDLGIILYHVKTDDKVAVITHTDFKRYENAGSEKRKGVEFDLKHNFDANWNGYINYAWQNGKITSTSGKESNNFDIPKHLLHTGIGYTKDKFNAILDAQYVSKRQAPNRDTGEYGAEDAFFVMNTYFNYKVTPNTTLQFGIQNLFDKEFYASEATSGRTYKVSVRYQF